MSFQRLLSNVHTCYSFQITKSKMQKEWTSHGKNANFHKNRGWFSIRMGNQAGKEFPTSPRANPPNSGYTWADQYPDSGEGKRKASFSKCKIVIDFFFFCPKGPEGINCKTAFSKGMPQTVFHWLWWGVRGHVLGVELESTLRNRKETHPTKQVGWWSQCSWQWFVPMYR